MKTATLLLEVGTEDLPPTALRQLSDAFAREVETQLGEAGLAFGPVTPYATPRRLAVTIEGLAAQQPDKTEKRRGPALTAAFDAAGNPTKAALGFARSCGVSVDKLQRLETDAGAWLQFENLVPGKPTTALVGDVTARALAKLPIPKRMRWGAGEVEFVRPAHWFVALFGADLVECDVLGLSSARHSFGHRFHHPEAIAFGSADDYAATLRSPGHVVASFSARREQIARDVAALSAKLGGAAVSNPALLDEVTGLVEWPVVISGEFDAHFLDLPEEVLIASMQGHQRYFPVRLPDGCLSNTFLTVANLDSTAPEVIRAGNERVIRPRLADADFFYRSDSKQPLADWYVSLQSMLFEKQLGTLLDKTQRVERLSVRLADACGAPTADAGRAAYLSRCDLMSAMVGEFPELQGVMGSYYAAGTESDAVSAALGEFYRPRFSGDEIPRTAIGRCIALADKLDTVVGIFGVGLLPTGDKDPYGLRRAALGILRILIEGGIDLDLDNAVQMSLAIYGDVELAPDTVSRVRSFIRERLRGYFLDRSVPGDVCAAVLDTAESNPLELERRVRAVDQFRQLDDARALVAANKRIANILRKAPASTAAGWRQDRLREDAEIALASTISHLSTELTELLSRRAYEQYLEQLAGLRPAVDAFFDEVMVMCEDIDVRNNRIALLRHLHDMFTRIADIGRLHEE